MLLRRGFFDASNRFEEVTQRRCDQVDHGREPRLLVACNVRVSMRPCSLSIVSATVRSDSGDHGAEGESPNARAMGGVASCVGIAWMASPAG